MHRHASAWRKTDTVKVIDAPPPSRSNTDLTLLRSSGNDYEESERIDRNGCLRRKKTREERAKTPALLLYNPSGKMNIGRRHRINDFCLDDCLQSNFQWVSGQRLSIWGGENIMEDFIESLLWADRGNFFISRSFSMRHYSLDYFNYLFLSEVLSVHWLTDCSIILECGMLIEPSKFRIYN